MRTLVHGFVVLCLGVALAAPAAAQKKGAKPAPKGEKTMFYNFDDMVVDGEFRRPSVLLTTARDQSRFERLLRLRKSFLPEMLKTARFPELKQPTR
ncbi:MAG: hypothetical protein HY906_06935 [Deltaproteobacteria bacterium]|nr:hypothetical protein [Deltaproteobacteria bacterium]